MDTLPTEMLELIFELLSPRDLAHCSAVCRLWYEVINQDCIWVKHCDPELEEPLRTIPSVATPKFEIPIAKILSPPSHWKIAFLREKHLWKTWRAKKILQLEEENILKFESINLLEVDFFSDTQIVVWYSNKIEILDVSITPPVIVAKTDIPVTIEEGLFLYVKVIENDLLFVQKRRSIEVFKVDIENKCIRLKYNISDGVSSQHFNVIKANFYIFYDGLLKILDLNTGKTLQEEPWPLQANQNETASLGFLSCSPTSDFLYVSFDIQSPNHQRPVCQVFVYSLKRLAYLPGPVITFPACPHRVLLHDRWMVIFTRHPTRWKMDNDITILCIAQNDKVLIHDRISLSTQMSSHYIRVCNGWFVFIVKGCDGNSTCLRAYSPSSKTLITIDENFKDKYFSIINNKVIAVFDGSRREHYAESTWKPSSQTIEKCDFPVVRGCKINRSFSKVVNRVTQECFSDLEVERYGNCWYVKHLW